MEFFLFFIFFVFAIPALYLFTKRIPKTSEEDTGGFQSSLPEGYGYPYFLDNTGYGLNVKENKIYILSNGIHYVFGLEKIRGFSSQMGGEIQYSNSATTIVGGGVIGGVMSGAAAIGGGRLGIAMKNAKERKKAFDNNGIFIEIADIDTPVLQIKFSSESEMHRSSEILQQFLDGTLIDYNEYIENKGTGGSSCSICKSQEPYIDASGKWYCPDCKKYVKLSS